jgi:hypothetical protein
VRLSPQSSTRPSSPQAVLSPARRGRTYAGVITYLLGFALLLVVMLHFFWIPTLESAHAANHLRRHWLGAVSWLMLAVVLVYLFAGLILTFRVGRFFLPRQREPRVRTKHVDAWAEAGKRIAEEKPED